MRAFIQNYYDYIMQGVIILLCLLAAAFIMVYMYGAVKDAYKRAHEQLVNAMKRSTGKNIFSYNYQAKRLNNLGVTYYSHGRITPVVYLIYKILILVTGLAAVIMSDPLMGIILAVSGYLLPDMFMELRNKEDNEKMLGSIMDIYDVMLLQINAGGYITQVLVDAYRVTTHPRLKAALMELTGDILTTNDLVLSMQVFEDKFDNENIHNLTVLVRQLSETGSASGLLSDIKKRLNILQESYNSSERTRVNRLIAVCTAAIAFAAIAVLGYAFLTGIADSAKSLL